MSTPGTNQQVAVFLQRAAAAYQAGRWDAADQALAQLLRLASEQPDAIHLQALLRAAQGDHRAALPLFARALALRPGQAEVLVNFGNSLRALGEFDAAVEKYVEATRIAPTFVNAFLGLAIAQQARGALPAAELSYRSLLALSPQSITGMQGLASVLLDMGRTEEAVAVNTNALTLPSLTAEQRAAVEHNLGLALSRGGKSEAALLHYDRASAVAPLLPQVELSRANALSSAGRFDESVAAYRRAIASNPLNIAAHQGLNHLLYRLGRDDEFLKSYDQASDRRPETAPLDIAKAQTLIHCDRYAEARESFQRALSKDPSNAVAWDGFAIAAAKLKDFGEAIAAHEKLLGSEVSDANAWTNYATTLLEAREYRKALEAAERALDRWPEDQRAIALLSLALRALNDGRDERLMGYEDFVQVFDLEVPRGYSNAEAFNRELNAYLNALHTEKREHFDQTLRGGTQTGGSLFGRDHAPVELLRERIDDAIRIYVARLRKDEAHPYLRRRRDRFGLSASWSSRLQDCGFHTNHIHPKGWISSCYYVAVPDAVADTEGKQGWIKFGEPAFDAGLGDAIRRSIQPKAGRLVLFPSYMWHGTAPFRSSQTRTTIAFDVVPKP